MMTRALIAVLGISTPLVAEGGTIPGYDGAVKTAVEKALGAYRGLDSYQDEAVMRFEFDADGSHPYLTAMGQQAEQVYSLSFARPNRIALVMGESGFGVYSNGEKIWRTMSMMNRYTENEAPETLSHESITEGSFGFDMGHPLVRVILSDKDTELTETLGIVSRFDSAEKEELNGSPGWRVRGMAKADEMPMGDGAFPFSIWIDDETGLVSELRIDMAEMMNQMMSNMGSPDDWGGTQPVEWGESKDGPGAEVKGTPATRSAEGAEASEDPEKPSSKPAPGMPKISKYEIVLEFKNVTINEDIPDERFVYTPGTSDEKVEDLSAGWFGEDDDEQADDSFLLIGEKAPAFEGEDIEGEAMALSDFDGRVVLLDFWATWSGPCVTSLASIQKIHTHFADKDVAVIGMNRDDESSMEQVKRMVEGKKLTYRQFNDSDETAGDKYKVSGIPTIVLIGKQGRIQSYRVSFGENEENQLIEEIEKLLNGEDLYDPAEIASRKDERLKQLEAEEQALESWLHGVTSLDSLKPHNTEALSKGESRSLQVNMYNMREADVDGDGAQDLIMSTYQGNSLFVVSKGGTKGTHIQFDGLDAEFGATEMNPVMTSAGMGWIVSSGSSMSRWSQNQTAHPQISLHDAGGALRWKYTLELPENSASQFSVTSGDINGDGKAEFAMGLTIYPVTGDDEDRETDYESGRTYLIILDEAGELISRQEMQKSIQTIKILTSADSDGSGSLLLFDEGNEMTTYHLKSEMTEP